MQSEDFFYEPRESVLKEIEKIPNEPEMSSFESAFLCGLLRKYKPKKILEVGIAAGGTSAIILKCLDILNISGAHLISVDLNQYFYRNKTKKSGFLADQVKIINNIQHTKILGKYLPEVIESIGGDIDFFILDTVHSSPGELLDFPVALPYLSENCIFCIHDIAYHLRGERSYDFSNQLLYNSIVADNIISYGISNDNTFFPNIGAARLNADTRKYFNSYFNTFSLPWKYMPKDDEITIYKNFYKKYYKDACFIFDLCCEAQQKSLSARNAIHIDDRKILSRLVFDYFIYKFKNAKNFHSIDFEFDKNCSWAILPISDDKIVHYEIFIIENRKLAVALHMASEKYNNYYDVFRNDDKLQSLNNYKAEIECTKYTSVTFKCDVNDIDVGVMLFNYLISNTLKRLRDIASDSIKLNFSNILYHAD